MLRGRREPFFTSDNVRDLHQMIVNDISKVVGGVAIRLNQDLVIEDIIVENDFPMHHVLPLADTTGDEHADHMRLSAGNPLFDFGLTQVEAEAIVLGRLMLFSALLNSKLLQSISCAEALISLSFLNH